MTAIQIFTTKTYSNENEGNDNKNNSIIRMLVEAIIKNKSNTWNSLLLLLLFIAVITIIVITASVAVTIIIIIIVIVITIATLILATISTFRITTMFSVTFLTPSDFYYCDYNYSYFFVIATVITTRVISFIITSIIVSIVIIRRQSSAGSTSPSRCKPRQNDLSTTGKPHWV